MNGRGRSLSNREGLNKRKRGEKVGNRNDRKTKKMQDFD